MFDQDVDKEYRHTSHVAVAPVPHTISLFANDPLLSAFSPEVVFYTRNRDHPNRDDKWHLPCVVVETVFRRSDPWSKWYRNVLADVAVTCCEWRTFPGECARYVTKERCYMSKHHGKRDENPTVASTLLAARIVAHNNELEFVEDKTVVKFATEHPEAWKESADRFAKWKTQQGDKKITAAKRRVDEAREEYERALAEQESMDCQPQQPPSPTQDHQS